MVVTMQRSVFHSLDDMALARACIEPTLQQIRGKDLTVKSHFYARLNTGQRALLMFWVLYGHASHGLAQFLSEVDHLLMQADLWSELKAGLDHFRDEEMLGLLQELEGVYRTLAARNRVSGADSHSVGAEDLDGELFATVGRLDALYQEFAPATLKRIGAYIRENPGEFVQIVD